MTVEQLHDVLRMQDQLNRFIAGEKWGENPKTKRGKIMQWDLALQMEVTEAMNCFSWKHWKDDGTSQFALTDKENLIVELIDMIHFEVSIFLLIGYKIKAERVGLVSFFFDNSYISSTLSATDQKRAEGIDDNSIFKRVARLMTMASTMGDYYGSYTTEELIDELKKVVSMIELTLETLACLIPSKDIYKHFLFKNILNIFRQNHGLQENTYQKIWGDKEDNYYLSLYNGEESYEALTEYLEEEYKKWVA